MAQRVKPIRYTNEGAMAAFVVNLKRILTLLKE